MSETPTTYRYYPALSDILKADDLPDFLSFIKDGLQHFFDKIYYKDYQVSKSVSGSSAFYSLQLVSRKKLALELPGTGVFFVLNPDYEDNTISSFPITVFWQWEVMRYIRYFNLNGFSFSIEDFYHLALEILHINEEQVLQLAVNTFVVTSNPTLSKIDQLIADINQLFNSTIAIDTTAENPLQELLIQIELINKKVFPAVFSLYLLASDLETTKQKVATFFSSFIPNDIEGYIKQIITPKARVTLKLSAAVEFPRNILVPWKEVSGVLERDEDVTHLARFKFAEALLYADTQAGIGYNLELAGTLNPTYCEIGRTGILIQIESLKLDLSKKRNIPEADADGRPADFTGVYAKAISVTLPSRWFHDAPVPGGTLTTLRLAAYDLLVGTGGVSGSIILESIPVITPGESPYYYEDKFNLAYPVTLLQKNTATNAIEETLVNDIASLKDLLFPSTSSNIPPYAFKFPLTLTELSGIGGQTRTFTNAADYQLYLTTLSGDNTLWRKVGSGSKGFLVGFDKFDITFKQNKVVSSNIKGALEIPRFKSGNLPLRIDVEGHLYEDGDFSITASASDGIPAKLFGFVHFKFYTFELGREDDNFFLGTSCDVWFSNSIMKKLLGDQVIKLPRVRIYSNGRFEIVGGNAFIPVNLSLHLGPIDIAVTGITVGSYQQEHNGRQRQYNYFGFDGAISLGPLGVDGKGKGIKYYYSVDDDELDGSGNPLGHHSFIRVQTIEIDLVIPGSAKPESAVAIIHGSLSIPDPGVSQEYSGKISLKLPKARISGGAAMRLQPKAPAFIIDAYIDLPAPIPLGPVAIYGFNAIIGYRYVAEKEAVGLVSGVNTWYEYYTHPQKGINIDKFSGPERTKAYNFPFSIGAGAVLGTSFDSGTILSIRAMLLLSIPTLFMLEGRASILSARLGLTDDKEPPFFAFIAWGDHSLEMGIGADFKLPKSNGWILDLYAEVQAGFFFNNASRWYVNFGTKEQPISARVLTILTAQTYLMLSARGIEAGARVEFDLNKRFGPAKVHIYAYVEVGGRISFERPQIGGYLAFGGMIDIEIWIIGITIGLDALLSVEAARPFLLYAELKIKVCVRIIVKVCKSFTIELKWEKDGTVDRTPIQPLPSTTTDTQQDRTKELVKAVHMMTNEVFNVQYFSSVPNESLITDIIPLDSYIDIKTAKGLVPNAVDHLIGGHVSAAENFTDLIPPDSVSRSGRHLRQVKHTYSIESIAIKAWTGSQWVNYHPYQAIIEGEDVTNLKIGYWQRSGNQYDTIRLLATTPFSYTAAGEPGWFVPEQYGINPSNLFCVTQQQTPHCSNVLNRPLGTVYYPPTQYVAHLINGVYYTLSNSQAYNPSIGNLGGLNGDFMKVTDVSNPFGFPQSLSFNNYNSLVILLPEPSPLVKLQLTTGATQATVGYYKKKINDAVAEPQYELVSSVSKTAMELLQPLVYENADTAIAKVVITPTLPPINTINTIESQIVGLFDNAYQNNEDLSSVTSSTNYQSLVNQLTQLTNGQYSFNSAHYFSKFFGSLDNTINNFSFDFIVKKGDYYFAATKTISYDEVKSLIIKINNKGCTVAEKSIQGNVSSLVVYNDSLLITTELLHPTHTGFATPILLKLDSSLTELKALQLPEPILSFRYSQICPTRHTDYAFWLHSNQADRMSTGDVTPAFTNGTRVLLVDLTTFEITDSILLEGTIALKAVALDTNACIFISEMYIQSTTLPPVITLAATSANTIEIKNNPHFNASFYDIAVLPNDDVVLTGMTGELDSTGMPTPFIGYLGYIPNPVLFTYASTNLDSVNAVKLGNSSMKDGQIWITAYNKNYIFPVRMNTNPSVVERYRLVKPSILQGANISINNVVSEPNSKEVLILCGNADHYKGALISITDEDINCCSFIKESLSTHFYQTVYTVLNIAFPELLPIVTASISVESLVTPSSYITVKKQVCPPIIKPPVSNQIQYITSLQQVCWLSITQYEYNTTIPGQAAIQAEQQSMVAGMQKTAQPIWRPNTSYYVHFRLKDTVDNGSSTPGLYDYYYGFKTTGPVGHYVVPDDNDPLTPDDTINHPLTSLRQYIDYNRSYPNADGNLLQAKPLFYGHEQCKISVFFAQAFAYHMLQTWPAYNGMPELSGEMHIAIKDPVTDVIIPYPLPEGWTSETVPLPAGGETWIDDNDPRIPHNIQMLNNMINYVNEHTNHIHCTLTIGSPIKPKAYTYSLTLTNLAPRKLYTALLYNAFEVNSDDVMQSKQIHEFVFQTSRYADFEEQVNSYILQDDNGNEKQAVFKTPLQITDEKIDTAYHIITNQPDPLSDALQIQYMHPFDRVTEGIFGLKPSNPAVTTEFSLLKDTVTGDTIAILVSNPEPFNIPKIPIETIQDTIVVLGAGSLPDNDYKVLHSKDYAQVLIMHSSKKISASDIVLRFLYKIWNGTTYITESTITTLPISINI